MFKYVFFRPICILEYKIIFGIFKMVKKCKVIFINKLVSNGSSCGDFLIKIVLHFLVILNTLNIILYFNIQIDLQNTHLNIKLP